MFGPTIKYIRTAKGITQIEVANACSINQGTYSKFEKNQIDLRSTTFLEIINFLNISLQEFLYIHNQFKFTNQETIILNFFNAPYNNAEVINQTKLECKELLNNYKFNPFIQDIYVLCDALLLLLQEHNIEQAKKLVKPIWDRLSKCNELFLYDIYLMNAMLFLFPLDDILKIKDFLERSIQKYIDYPNMKRLFINLKLNIVILCIAEQRYEQGLAIIETAIEPAKEIKAFIQLAIAYIRKGICLKGQTSSEWNTWIKKGMDILNVVEEYGTLDLMQEEINNYVN